MKGHIVMIDMKQVLVCGQGQIVQMILLSVVMVLANRVISITVPLRVITDIVVTLLCSLVPLSHIVLELI